MGTFIFCGVAIKYAGLPDQQDLRVGKWAEAAEPLIPLQTLSKQGSDDCRITLN